MNITQGPIVACSTCLQGNAGLAVLRLSGFESLSSLQKLFKQSIENLVPRKQVRVDVLGHNREELDDALACFFPGPNSFTGENVLELSVHGNVFHVERLLDYICQDFGFSIAAPGEFTLRAYKSGKLKLSQVEGLDLLLNADSAYVFDQGLAQLTGELHQQYMLLHDSLLQLKASVELAIDFSDDVGEQQARDLRTKHANDCGLILRKLNQRATASIGSLLEPSIVFVGVPNAGKSTLFNRFLGDDRAIVSASAGTTRDFLMESVRFDFGRVRLVDTAGLRATLDSIEEEGVKRSLSQSSFAFLRVLVVNPLLENALPSEDLGDLDLIICTHADVDYFENGFKKCAPLFPINVPVVLWGHDFDSGSIGAKKLAGSIGAKTFFGPMGARPQSGPIEPGVYIADPERIINNLAAFKYDILTKNKPILIERQRRLIRNLYDEFNKFSSLMEEIDDIAIISSELQQVVIKGQELIGIYSPDDVLHHIFANFCIGK